MSATIAIPVDLALRLGCHTAYAATFVGAHADNTPDLVVRKYLRDEAESAKSAAEELAKLFEVRS